MKVQGSMKLAIRLKQLVPSGVSVIPIGFEGQLDCSISSRRITGQPICPRDPNLRINLCDNLSRCSLRRRCPEKMKSFSNYVTMTEVTGQPSLPRQMSLLTFAQASSVDE
jgi:hypothetical protein